MSLDTNRADLLDDIRGAVEKIVNAPDEPSPNAALIPALNLRDLIEEGDRLRAVQRRWLLVGLVITNAIAWYGVL